MTFNVIISFVLSKATEQLQAAGLAISFDFDEECSFAPRPIAHPVVPFEVSDVSYVDDVAVMLEGESVELLLAKAALAAEVFHDSLLETCLAVNLKPGKTELLVQLGDLVQSKADISSLSKWAGSFRSNPATANRIRT